MDDSTGYYDEHIYLNSNGNARALAEIAYEKKQTDKKIVKSAVDNGYSIKIYNDFVKLIAYLIKVLNMHDNAICASMIIKVLIEKGVFSFNDKFIFTNEIKKEVTGFFGLNVILGHGCCRHVAHFQSDVLTKMNLMSDVFYCYISEQREDEAHKMKANHAINLIEHKDILYGYDTERDALFRIIDANEMTSIYKSKPFYVYYKPYIDMLLNGMQVQNAVYMLRLFEMFRDYEVIDEKEYLEILMYVRNVIEENQSLIKDFRHSSKQYTKRIISNLK